MNDREVRHVLILGARAPVALEWARAFSIAGWRVSAGDSLHFSMTRSSRSSKHFLRLPSPRKDFQAWTQALKSYVVEQSVDCILPTCEEVFYLAKASTELPCQVATSDFLLLHRLHHKQRFSELISTLPIRTPDTFLIEDEEQLTVFAETSHDMVFKPAYSRFANGLLVRPSFAVLRSIHPSRTAPWVAQRFVAGREVCSFSVFSHGRLTAHTAYIPRYRIGRGSGIWFDPVSPHEVREFVEAFGELSGYNGQVGFDFIRSEGGRWYVLECNPRATSGVHLLAQQPNALVKALTGDVSPSSETLPAPRQVAMPMLILSLSKLGRSPEFWRDYFAAPDVVARWSDPLPAMFQGFSFLELAWNALLGRRGVIQNLTHDIEWDGESFGKTR